jgi:hypothetical protein
VRRSYLKQQRIGVKQMKAAAALAVLVMAGVAGGAAIAASDQSSSASSSDNCKVVHLKPGENPPSGMSTSVQAGNGSVSAQSTVGNGISVHSGNGSVGATSMSSSTNGNTTIVTSSDGHCTKYIKSGG